MKLSTIRAVVDKTKRTRVGTTTLVKLAIALEPTLTPVDVRDLLINLSRRKVLDHDGGRWYYNRQRYSSTIMGFDKEVLGWIPYFPYFVTFSKLRRALGITDKEQNKELLKTIHKLYRRRAIDRSDRFIKLKDKNKIVSYPIMYRIVRRLSDGGTEAKSRKKAPSKHLNEKAEKD